MDYTEEQLKDALEKHAEWIENSPGVATAGLAIGQEHPLCIMVYGDRVPLETRQAILDRLKGYPVEFDRKPRGIAY